MFDCTTLAQNTQNVSHCENESGDDSANKTQHSAVNVLVLLTRDRSTLLSSLIM